ncbi:aminoacyl-tRNA hydrolase [Alkaliphilus sp. B6464]|uniref:aminoacyl-tRNA hydrolase n=1 Tax=Alkaliphilus sp. B6464 TaxID=2731219 RepID=UPI002012386F|nr:aminoacyl-tRNA hydrolase [Alkaliphilus sp. B6464]
MNLAMYILVNNDIKIGKGKLAGQVGHAVEVLYEKKFYDEEILNHYRKNRKKIILSCSQSKLEELEKEGYAAIRDLGLTQLESNTLTCINLGIVDRNNLGVLEFIKELKLYSK